MYNINEKVWLTKISRPGVIKEINGEEFKITFFDKKGKRTVETFKADQFVKFNPQPKNEMKINKVEKHSAEELIEKLHNISLFKNPEIKVYENTLITLEKMNVNFMSPTQKYLMKQELRKVKSLYFALQKFGVDLFNLNGYVTIHIDDADPIDVLPIVVEESIEANGRLHTIINDGMHRAWIARDWNIIPQVVYVRGIDTEKYPYYAYPSEKGWKQKLDFLEVIPEDYVKKIYRFPDNHKFYFRNFNSQFSNTQGARKREGDK